MLVRDESFSRTFKSAPLPPRIAAPAILAAISIGDRDDGLGDPEPGATAKVVNGCFGLYQLAETEEEVGGGLRCGAGVEGDHAGSWDLLDVTVAVSLTALDRFVLESGRAN